MRVWIGRREQTRRHGSGSLGDLLEPGEQHAYLGSHQPGRPTTSPRSTPSGTSAARSAFLFEVEWTAMLGEPLLRRHARIPPDDALVRFLVIAPERTELVRYKLERSPLLRAALDAGNWHIIKSNHLRDVPGPRPARPGRPGAVPRARPGHRAERRPDAAVRRADPATAAPTGARLRATSGPPRATRLAPHTGDSE